MRLTEHVCAESTDNELQLHKHPLIVSKCGTLHSWYSNDFTDRLTFPLRKTE